MLHGIVKKDLRDKPPVIAKSTAATTEIYVDKFAKVREYGLRILHLAWRAWFDRVEVNDTPTSTQKWQNHVEFRNELVAVLERIVTEGYP